MDWYIYPLVVLAGFFAGAINTLAGSGSLITLPVLIFLGLPATVANGTNRVAILLQNVVGASSYQSKGVLDAPGAVKLSLPALLGALIGAQIAVNLNEEMMRRVIGLLMIVMMVVILLRPQRWRQGDLQSLPAWPTVKQALAMFAVGLYGGFIQAGVGIFLLSLLVLVIGYDLLHANAVKVVVVLIFTLFALLVFVRNDQVDWGIGLLLASGNMLGAWVATGWAVERGSAWVRRILLLTIALSAAYLLGMVDWLLAFF
jgi:uncharacterized membrane protein YfcA